MAGTITTPVDLITLALKTAGVIGVGQTPDFTDTNDCFIILNAMIAQWNRNRWLVYHLIDTSIASTGAQSYSVGAGGDFNIPRPDRLETAFVRLRQNSPSNPFDYQLGLIQSREDYSAITLKSLTTWPTSIFLDSDYPLGHVYFWPIPNTQFDLHIVTKATLPTFPTLTTQIALPPEYLDCLIWNLSVRIRPLFQLPPEPTIVALAKNALNVIRQANAQVPELRMPGEVMNTSSGIDPTLGNMNSLPWAI